MELRSLRGNWKWDSGTVWPRTEENTHPSMKTAASASLYVMKPVPWKPTTEYANWKTASELS